MLNTRAKVIGTWMCTQGILVAVIMVSFSTLDFTLYPTAVNGGHLQLQIRVNP